MSLVLFMFSGKQELEVGESRLNINESFEDCDRQAEVPVHKRGVVEV